VLLVAVQVLLVLFIAACVIRISSLANGVHTLVQRPDVRSLTNRRSAVIHIVPIGGHRKVIVFVFLFIVVVSLCLLAVPVLVAELEVIFRV